MPHAARLTAIGRLEQEGLLKVLPKRGIVVSGFTFSDISMIFEVRRLIEPYALRHYGSRLDLAEVKRYSEIFHAHMSSNECTEFYHLDDQFHALLISVLENDYLLELYSRIQTQNTRLRVMSGHLSTAACAALWRSMLRSRTHAWKATGSGRLLP